MRLALTLLLALALGAPVRLAAQSWTRLDTGLPDTYIPNQLLHEGGDTYLVMLKSAPLETRLLRSTDEGTTWTVLPGYPSGAFNARLFFYALGGDLVTWTENGRDGTVVLLRSSDRGATWTSRELTGIQTPLLSIVQTGAGVLAGTTSQLLRSTDGMVTWTRVAGSPTGATRLLRVGGALVAGVETGQVYRSTDDGATWTQVRIGITGSATDLWAVGTTLYAKGFFGNLFASTDGGATWTEDTATYAPFTWSAVRPTVPGSAWLLVSTADLFHSTDRGRTATAIGASYPKTSGGALCGQPLPSGPTAYFGQVIECSPALPGLYRYRPGGGVAAGGEARPAALALSATPNPARGPVAIAVGLDRAERARVAVFDVLGREVARLHDAPLAPGTHRFVWDGAAATGAYLVRLTTASGSAVRTVVRP